MYGNRYDGISAFDCKSEDLHFGLVPAAGQGSHDVLEQLSGVQAESGLGVSEPAFEEEAGDEAGERIPEPTCPWYEGLIEVAGANDEAGLFAGKGIVQAGYFLGVVLAVGIDDDGALDLGVVERGLETLDHCGAFTLVAGQSDEAYRQVDFFETSVGAAIVDDDNFLDDLQDIFDYVADVWPGVVARDDNDGMGAQGLIFSGAVHET